MYSLGSSNSQHVILFIRFRFLDKATKKHYYANIRLNASTWQRPELENFEPREIEYLKSMYKEEMANFGCVTIDQFIDVLREVGESCSKRWILQLFRATAER